jgi:hypothetical protein
MDGDAKKKRIGRLVVRETRMFILISFNRNLVVEVCVSVYLLSLRTYFT